MNRTMAPRQHISDVVTEAGYSSVATTAETIIDTRSEPPGFRPRDYSERLMNRAEAVEGVGTSKTNNTNGAAAIITTSISPDPPVDDDVLVGGLGGSNKVRSLPARPMMTKLEAKLSRVVYDQGSSSKRPTTQHQQQGEDKEGEEGRVKSSTTSKSSHTHRVAAKNYPSSQTLKSQQYSSQSYTKNYNSISGGSYSGPTTLSPSNATSSDSATLKRRESSTLSSSSSAKYSNSISASSALLLKSYLPGQPLSLSSVVVGTSHNSIAPPPTTIRRDSQQQHHHSTTTVGPLLALPSSSTITTTTATATTATQKRLQRGDDPPPSSNTTRCPTRRCTYKSISISSSVGQSSAASSLLLSDERGGGSSVVVNNNVEINNDRIIIDPTSKASASSSYIVNASDPPSAIQLRNSDPPSICSSTLHLSTGTLRRTKKGGDDAESSGSSVVVGDHQSAMWNEDRSKSPLGGGGSMSSSSSSSSSSGDDSANDDDEDDNDTKEEDLNSAVRRALDIGIAKHDGSEGSISSNDDDDDDDDDSVEQDSVEEDDEDDNDDKLTRITEGEDEEDGDSRSSQRVLVKTEAGGAGGNRFLAAAVDNYHAMVPIDSAIYEAYDHTFVTCPECLRFRFLYTFLRKNLNKKIMIFFSTTNSVRYHAGLLDMFHIPVLTMHGSQRREKFVNRFFKFSDMDEGILCSTDAAGRDLDIPPSVDWVIQFEPPDDPSEFILRVARISCDSDRVGRSLLFLNPGEKQGFLKYYQSASIPISEFELPANLADVQNSIANAANMSETFLRRARDAYGSYLIAYASHGFRDVYNVHDLNKGDVAIAFGLVDGLSPIKDDDSAADFTVETGTVVTKETGYGRIEPRRGEENKTKKKGGKWKKEKTTKKTWMKGEKSWPHSQIRLHPNFKGETGHH